MSENRVTSFPIKNFVVAGTALSKFLNSRIRWCSTFHQDIFKERKCGIIPRFSEIKEKSDIVNFMKRGIKNSTLS